MCSSSPRRGAELVRRLTGRGTEPPEVVERRARLEWALAAASEFDVTLVNTSIDEVCRQLVTLINRNQLTLFIPVPWRVTPCQAGQPARGRDEEARLTP